MNNKIIIEIFVPQLRKTYDVFIPISITINVAISLVLKSLNEMTEGQFVYNNQLRLYKKEDGIELNHTSTVKDSGLQNGSKVILL